MSHLEKAPHPDLSCVQSGDLKPKLSKFKAGGTLKETAFPKQLGRVCILLSLLLILNFMSLLWKENTLVYMSSSTVKGVNLSRYWLCQQELDLPKIIMIFVSPLTGLSPWIKFLI